MIVDPQASAVYVEKALFDARAQENITITQSFNNSIAHGSDMPPRLSTNHTITPGSDLISPINSIIPSKSDHPSSHELYVTASSTEFVQTSSIESDPTTRISTTSDWTTSTESDLATVPEVDPTMALELERSTTAEFEKKLSAEQRTTLESGTTEFPVTRAPKSEPTTPIQESSTLHPKDSAPNEDEENAEINVRLRINETQVIHLDKGMGKVVQSENELPSHPNIAIGLSPKKACNSFH